MPFRDAGMAKVPCVGSRKPLPYDQYCAITPEEAEKIFKKLKNKVDFLQYRTNFRKISLVVKAESDVFYGQLLA